jgi:hypothetical protein
MSGQSSLPIDVWIDGRNRVRQYQVQVPLYVPIGLSIRLAKLAAVTYLPNPLVGPMVGPITPEMGRNRPDPSSTGSPSSSSNRPPSFGPRGYAFRDAPPAADRSKSQ